MSNGVEKTQYLSFLMAGFLFLETHFCCKVNFYCFLFSLQLEKSPLGQIFKERLLLLPILARKNIGCRMDVALPVYESLLFSFLLKFVFYQLYGWLSHLLLSMSTDTKFLFWPFKNLTHSCTEQAIRVSCMFVENFSQEFFSHFPPRKNFLFWAENN